jgi:hypothetical protein
VLAGRGDLAAAALVHRLTADRARLMTCADLAKPGWRVEPSDPTAGRAVLGGELVPTRWITGVLTRLPAVTERELPMIDPADRAYSAAEMTAFLSYWLTALPCPVLNRPTASTLCGPGWRTERWLLAADRLGIAGQPRRRRVSAFGTEADCSGSEPVAPAELTSVTVVGRRCFGTTEPELARQAQALADAAGVQLLVAHFRRIGPDHQLIDAHPWVDLHQPEITTAIDDYFTAGGS